MDEPRHSSDGLLNSARRLAETSLAIVQNRIELIGLELREEKFRIVEILLWLAAFISFGMLALTVITFTVVFVFWKEHANQALIAVSAVYVIAAVVCFFVLRSRMRNRPMPFSQTVSELKKDREWLQDRS